jgi:hypothetical protein
MDEPTRNVAVTFAILPYGSLENWAVGQSKRLGWPTGHRPDPGPTKVASGTTSQSQQATGQQGRRVTSWVNPGSPP